MPDYAPPEDANFTNAREKTEPPHLARARDESLRVGMIGAVGALLGNADINIASMVVTRDTPRGESIMVLSPDDPVPPPVFEKLRPQKDIEWVKVLRL